MIPYLGIYIGERYDHNAIRESRKAGILFLILFALGLSLTTREDFFLFLLVGAYILFFVLEAIYLLLYGRYIAFRFLDYIPSMQNMELYCLASMRNFYEFVRVIFGQEKRGSLSEYIQDYRERYYIPLENPTVAYFMPFQLLGLPFWNLFSIPTLFQEQYHPYRRGVVLGLILTLLFSLSILFLGANNSAAILLLAIPILHMFFATNWNSAVRPPILGILLELWTNKKSPQA
jgi:hypothetical protein